MFKTRCAWVGDDSLSIAYHDQATSACWNDLLARLPLVQGPFLTTSTDKEVVSVPRKTATLQLLITGEEGR